MNKITNPKKYHITTYGCQMNIHESEKLAGIMDELGYLPVKNVEEADIAVFNTCCIREHAEQRAEGNIGALKPLKKKKKDMIIAVGGCMTQQTGKAGSLKEKFPFVDIFFGTHNLPEFKELLLKRQALGKTVLDIPEKEGDETVCSPVLRTSYPNAWVNIMYGCDNFCSYCIVPYVRGRERSRKREDILAEIKDAVDSGFKEITLLGQNVNSYSYGFSGLLRDAAAIEGKFRLRFMTSHPKDFNADVVKAIKENDKICNSVHLPVQSGSDRILGLMNRRYTKEDYLNKLKMIRENLPDAAVTTDIMVGFPGETEEDFEETLSLVKEARFQNAFTFVYSKRSGTSACDMPGHIDEAVKKDRISRLIKEQNAVTRALSRESVGKRFEVLCEGYDEQKQKHLGRDEYGRMIYFDGNSGVLGKFVTALVTRAGGMSLFGEILED